MQGPEQQPDIVNPDRRVARLALGAMLVLSSAFQVLKYSGAWGLGAYALAVLLLVRVPCGRVLDRLRALPVGAGWLAAATVLSAVVLFVVIYPIADSGVIGGGSDRDDALNVGAASLLEGRYPYRELTYLGNPLSPLPGALLLAIPFVLMGNAAYQTFFWLPVFMLAAGRAMGSRLSGVLLSWTVLILSPANLIGVVTGDDLLANSIYVFVFTILLIREAARRPRLAMLLAVLLGVALSSRPNYALLLPLLFGHLRQHAGTGAAMRLSGIAAAAAAAVTVPFYLHAPEAFAPLHVSRSFSSPIPYGEVIVPLLAGVLAVVLARRPTDPDGAALCGRFALVGFLLVLALHVTGSVRAGALVADALDYGRLYLVFGAFAVFFAEQRAAASLTGGSRATTGRRGQRAYTGLQHPTATNGRRTPR